VTAFVGVADWVLVRRCIFLVRVHNYLNHHINKELACLNFCFGIFRFNCFELGYESSKLVI
jgi:hypothetical protein